MPNFFQRLLVDLNFFRLLLAELFGMAVLVAVILAVICYSLRPLFEKIARSSVTQTGAALAGLMVLIGLLYGVSHSFAQRWKRRKHAEFARSR